MDTLGGSSWFSELDQGKVYHHGFLEEQSRPLTAFITPWGLYEWVCIPFGVSSAPAEFQRSMDYCLTGLRDTVCLPYLNDNLVHSGSFEEYLEHVRLVLQRYKEHGVKMTPKKRELFKRKVRFLGKMVTGEGYTMDPVEIAPAMALKERMFVTVGGLQQMLGFLPYYYVKIENRNPCKGIGVIKTCALSLVRDSNTSISHPFTPSQICEAQEKDEVLAQVIWFKSQGRRPNGAEIKAEKPAVATLLKQWLKISLDKDGILRRRTFRREQLVVPESYQPLIFKKLHQDMGHLGVERTLYLIGKRFYWPQMHQDVEHFVTKVCECVKKKKPCRQARAPLTPILTTYPFELVSIDFLDKCKHGYEYILYSYNT